MQRERECSIWSQISFEERFHIGEIEGQTYCFFIDGRGLRQARLSAAEAQLAQKLKSGAELSASEKADALRLLWRLEPNPSGRSASTS